MPNPKRKLAKSWRGCRRSHDHVHIPNLSICPRCSQPKMAHRVCGTCGYYKGAMIVDMKKL
jgi:large subunit ribosomal protein L32